MATAWTVWVQLFGSNARVNSAQAEALNEQVQRPDLRGLLSEAAGVGVGRTRFCVRAPHGPSPAIRLRLQKSQGRSKKSIQSWPNWLSANRGMLRAASLPIPTPNPQRQRTPRSRVEAGAGKRTKMWAGPHIEGREALNWAALANGGRRAFGLGHGPNARTPHQLTPQRTTTHHNAQALASTPPGCVVSFEPRSLRSAPGHLHYSAPGVPATSPRGPTGRDRHSFST